MLKHFFNVKLSNVHFTLFLKLSVLKLFTLQTSVFFCVNLHEIWSNLVFGGWVIWKDCLTWSTCIQWLSLLQAVWFFLLQTKPYDAKKSCWVPDEKEGFVLGEIRNATGDQVTVAFGNKVKTMMDTLDTASDTNLDYLSEMISLNHIWTLLKQTLFFETGAKISLNPNHCNKVKLSQIPDTLCTRIVQQGIQNIPGFAGYKWINSLAYIIFVNFFHITS